MKRACRNMILLGSFFFMAYVSRAQLDSQSKNVGVSIGAIALMDIESSGSVSLSVNALSEAGMGLGEVVDSDQTLWINYSCSDHSSGSKRIDANISAGTIPSGLQLHLTAGSYSGSGDGVLGNSTGAKILSGTSQTIIDGIVRGYTGNGTGNGHQLNYELKIDQFGDLSVTSSAVITVQFTIIDN